MVLKKAPIKIAETGPGAPQALESSERDDNRNRLPSDGQVFSFWNAVFIASISFATASNLFVARADAIASSNDFIACSRFPSFHSAWARL
jgi:hypothetical protein